MSDNQSANAIMAVVNKIMTSPELADFVKGDPDKVKKMAEQMAREMYPPPLDSDPWIYRMVVFSLGVTIISVVFGVLLITYKLMMSDFETPDFRIPDILTAIGSAAVGALSGLLAPSPVRSKS